MNRILLLLDHKENRRLLAEWLSQKYQVISAESEQALDEPFDLGILDGPALDRLWERVQARKEAEQPLFLPFLLVTARKDVRYVTRHLWRTVDELILTPIEKVELQARVEILLRARRYSHEQTARLKAEAALDAITQVLERVTDGFVALDKNWNYTYLNQKAAQLLNRQSPADLLGKNYWEEYPEAAGTPFAQAYQRAMEEQVTIVLEDYYAPWDRWFENRIYPSPDGISIFFTEITERKRMEEKLRESEARLNYLFAVNPAIVYALDPENFSPTWISPNVTEITGYTPEEARQPGWWAEHVHPEDWEDAKKAQERLMVEDRVAHEYRFQKKDGTYIWVRDELRLLRDEQGKPTEIVGSWMNITDRKEAEIALAKSEQRYRSVVENTGTAMIIINEDNSIAFANQQCTATTGYSPEELQGTDWRNYVLADDLPMMENYFRLRFRDPDKAPNRYEIRLIHADGSIRNALLTVGTIPSTRQVVVSILDITERKRAEEERAHSHRLLLALSQAAQAVQRAHSTQQVYEAVGSELAKLGYNATMLTLTDDGTHLTVAHTTFAPSQVRAVEKLIGLSAQNLRLPLVEGGVLHRVLKKREAVFAGFKVERVAESLPSSLRPLAGRLAALLGLKRGIVAPLVVGGEPHGLLVVTGTDLSEADVPAISTFANQAAIALENAQLLSSLTEQREQLRALGARLAEIAEEERRRLARELHDRVGQNLTALSVNIGVARSLLPPETAPQVIPRLDDSIALLEETAERIRDVMGELRPPTLDEYGLLATLRWYCQRFRERTGLAVTVQGEETMPRLPSAVETALFRIAQEALTNVARHAQASRVTVSLEPVDGGARLTIADDGVGFDPAAPRRPGEPPSWGLLTMRERAEAVGGRLKVESAPGKGTQVVVEVVKGERSAR